MRAFLSALFGATLGAFIGVQVGASLMLAWLPLSAPGRKP